MPALLPADLSRAQWDYVVNTMRTEMASGRLKSCSWTNSAGNSQTTTLADVRRSLHLWTRQAAGQPSAGVQLTRFDTAPRASGRKTLITEFTIRVSVESVAYTVGVNAVPANGDDALAQCWALISDGNGNGLSEIFRYGTLGGNANAAYITTILPALEIGDGETPQIWADLYVTLHCEKPLGLI